MNTSWYEQSKVSPVMGGGSGKISIQNVDLYPRYISLPQAGITILPNGGHYIAYVQFGGRMFELSIHLTSHDVKDINKLLQEAIQRVASSFGNEQYYTTALEKLAYTGNYAFRRIFYDHFSQSIIRNALSTCEIVQIASKDFFVPWELLYDGLLDSGAHISHYWGMRYIISRCIIQDTMPGENTPQVMEANRPKVGLITSDRLSSVVEKEIPAFKALHRKKRIRLSVLRGLTEVQRYKDLAKLGRFLSRDWQILHFACHAYEQEPLEKSYLFITKDFPLSMIDFVVCQYELKHHPFVILNACLTSIMNPLYTSSWAEKFWERGARGILATDFQVPDWFAASFSEMLYQHLLSELSIGESLFRIRRQLWTENRNPLGLAYALYSSPSITIAKSKKKEEII
jgi:hypothetical protein